MRWQQSKTEHEPYIIDWRMRAPPSKLPALRAAPGRFIPNAGRLLVLIQNINNFEHTIFYYEPRAGQ